MRMNINANVDVVKTQSIEVDLTSVTLDPDVNEVVVLLITPNGRRPRAIKFSTYDFESPDYLK